MCFIAINLFFAKFTKNPILFQYKHVIFVKFGFIVGICTFLGSNLILFSVLSTFGKSKEYRIMENALFYLPIVALTFSIFGLRIFSPNYLYESIKKIKANKWQRPPASFYYGILACILYFYLICIMNHINIIYLSDILAPTIMFTHGLSRLACLNYGCCYGNIQRKPRTLYIAYVHPYSYANRKNPLYFGYRRIPIQFIECIIGIIVSFILFLVLIKINLQGATISLYFMSYGIFRFITEKYRQLEDRRILGFTIWQLFSIAFFIFGVFLGFLTTKREPVIFNKIETNEIEFFHWFVGLINFTIFSFVLGIHKK